MNAKPAAERIGSAVAGQYPLWAKVGRSLDGNVDGAAYISRTPNPGRVAIDLFDQFGYRWVEEELGL